MKQSSKISNFLDGNKYIHPNDDRSQYDFPTKKDLFWDVINGAQGYAKKPKMQKIKEDVTGFDNPFLSKKKKPKTMFSMLTQMRRSTTAMAKPTQPLEIRRSVNNMKDMKKKFEDIDLGTILNDALLITLYETNIAASASAMAPIGGVGKIQKDINPSPLQGKPNVTTTPSRHSITPYHGNRASTLQTKNINW